MFLVLLNASAGLITASGLGAALNVNPEIGGDGKIDGAEASAEEIKPSQGNLDTLYSLFVSTTGTMEDIFTIITYGPQMLMNLGVPTWIVGFVGAPATFIVAMDVVHFLTGRG